MISVCRIEEKYPLDLLKSHHYKDLFSKILSTDSYSRNGEYTVRSLYFDTVDDKDFFQKINEQNLRRKIRLRIYNPDDAYAKLEMKQKQNIYQRKRSLIVSRADAIKLIQGDFGVLLNYEGDFPAELFSIMTTEAYMPKSIVEYNRFALMAKENNIRLTFDSNIRATESSFDLFSKELPMYSVFPIDRVIFEVKYDKFMLGYISDIISNVDVRNISSSKYCLSRTIGYPCTL